MICGLGRIGTLFGFPSGMALRRIQVAQSAKGAKPQRTSAKASAFAVRTDQNGNFVFETPSMPRG
jgi:hypothetical protein